MASSIDPKKIRIDCDTQARLEMNDEVIAEYAAAMERGDEFPAIQVFYLEERDEFILSDGFFRYFAHMRVRPNDPILAEVRLGNVQDAQWASFAANKTHGWHRSNADKRNAAQRALLHPKGTSLSDRQIAKHVGVHWDTVGTIRRDLELTVGIRQSNLRIGLDGRAINIKNIDKAKSEEKDNSSASCNQCLNFMESSGECAVNGSKQRPWSEQAAVNAVYDYLRHKDGNPCVVLPTGSGKTPVLSTICHDAVTKWAGRVLVLAHVKELLEQSANTLRQIAPDLPVGVYSAGLNSRDTNESVIVAGIQSIYTRAQELGHFDLIIVDESHLLPPDGEGMYQTFLTAMREINAHIRLIGLTATPYRMKSGMLCGPENLLHDICYEIGVKQLIGEKYLCPLKTKGGRSKVDCSNLHVRAGEFISSEVEELMDNADLVASACREIIMQTQNRHSVLIFAASVAHAGHVKETVQKYSGCECGLVTGETPSAERETLLKRFKGEKVDKNLFGDALPQLKFLVNVNVLTTGFDAPNVDCVVLLRPTASPGLLLPDDLARLSFA